MTNLRSRLKKLETQMTDKRGLVAYSKEWIAYWQRAVDRLLSDEEPDVTERIPIEFVDLILAEANRERTSELVASGDWPD